MPQLHQLPPSDQARILGRAIVIDRDGRELSTTEAAKLGPDEKRDRRNGPHHDARWARHLLDTPTQAEVRRENRVYGFNQNGH